MVGYFSLLNWTISDKNSLSLSFSLSLSPLPSSSIFPQFKSRITKDGDFVVTSQEQRSQHHNLETAIHKLEHMLHEASEVPQGPNELTLARIKTLWVHYDKSIYFGNNLTMVNQFEEPWMLNYV